MEHEASTTFHVTQPNSTSVTSTPMRRTGDIHIVPIGSLLPADSPRLGGMDEEHVRRLAEMETTLPPILVHRPTMRVIDGMHRLRAAMLTGKQEIHAEYFEGSEDDGFIQAVKANVAHGLPLTLADRRAAAMRILATHPRLSDRAIGSYTGLAHKTVSALRSRSTGEDTHSNTRLGADGRLRPLSSQEGRRRAAEVMAERPSASLREVAASAGISVGTAHDVRQRLQRGESPLRSSGARHRGSETRFAAPLREEPQLDKFASPARGTASDAEAHVILQSLLKDPSLKRTDAGRALLQWLHSHVINRADWEPLIETIPAYRLQSLAALARQCRDHWDQFAYELECRERLVDVTDRDDLSLRAN